MAERHHATQAGLLRGRGMTHVVLVFLLAVAIKSAYLHERLQFPDIANPTMDSLYHDRWARGIAFGEWTKDQERIGHEAYFRAPLYPFFVAAVYRVAGTAPGTLFTVQLLLGALTVVLIFVFCRRVFDTRTAWVGVILALGYWPLTYYEAERLIPALILPLDMLLLLLLFRAGRSGALRNTAAAGAVCGLSAIARPSILIVVPVVLLWLWRRLRPGSSRHVLAFTAALALLILPVTVRNAVRGGDLVFVSSQGGVNFFIGNNAQSNGVTAVVPGTRADWWGGFEDTQRIARDAAGGELKPSGISRYWYGRGVSYLLSEPVDAARLYLRKAMLLLGNAEPSNERQLYFRRQDSRVLSHLPVGFGLILALAVLGLLAIRTSPRLSRTDKQEALLPLALGAAYAVGVLAFFITSRYRLPVVIFMLPISAFGTVTLYDTVRQHRWRTALGRGVLAGGIVIAALWNPFGVGTLSESRGEYNVGVDYFHTGQYTRALPAFDRSVAAEPGYAPAWLMRGRTHDQLGQRNAALQDLRMATRLDPSLATASLWLGVVLQKEERNDEAERAYRKTLELDPRNLVALNNLADIYLRRSNPEAAMPYLHRALAVDSTFVNSIYGLGYCYELLGKHDLAVASYRRALPYPPARARLERIERQRSTGSLVTEVPGPIRQ